MFLLLTLLYYAADESIPLTTGDMMVDGKSEYNKKIDYHAFLSSDHVKTASIIRICVVTPGLL
jgi:hypothetical protein